MGANWSASLSSAPFFPFCLLVTTQSHLYLHGRRGGSTAACLICSRPHVFFTNCSHISFSFPVLLLRKTIRKPQMGATVHWSHPWLRLPSQFISLTVSASARICWNRCLLILTACCLPQSVGQQVTNAHIPTRTHKHTQTYAANPPWLWSMCV